MSGITNAKNVICDSRGLWWQNLLEEKQQVACYLLHPGYDISTMFRYNVADLWVTMWPHYNIETEARKLQYDMKVFFPPRRHTVVWPRYPSIATYRSSYFGFSNKVWLITKINHEVIQEIRKKLKALKYHKRFSCRPVLIHVNGVTDDVVDSDYFAKVIDFSQLLNNHRLKSVG